MKQKNSYLSILFILLNFTVTSFGNNAITPANDTLLLNNYCQLAVKYSEANRDSSIYYANLALGIAEKLKQKFYQASILSDLGYTLMSNGDLANALTKLLTANKLIEDKNIAWNVIITPFFKQYFTSDDPKINRIILLGYIKNSLAMLYGRTANFDKQLSELKETKRIIESETKDLNLRFIINNNIANAYLNMGNLDSALYFQKIVLNIEKKIENKNYRGASNKAIGDIHFRKGNFEDAKTNYLIGLNLIKSSQNIYYMALSQFALADTYRKLGLIDSSLYYSKAGITNYKSLGSNIPEMEQAYTALAMSFRDENKNDSAFYYLELSKKLSDSINDKEINTLTTFQNIGFREQMRLKEVEAGRIKIKNRTQIFILLSGLILFSIIAFILYRSNKMKVRANLLLEKQKQQIENTLVELKSTQAQLIQSEKMASLGELTAGIAHEIQNPLNFVNNFSEVSNELIDEVLEERSKEKGKRDEELESELLSDIKQNLQKINHHGQRASSIVKGMLEHSRTSSGKKEATDINVLCDEYLRLAYHGLRAKDKTFNATFETHFDPDLPKIDVIPQDIGRVVLNIITNAFYAVNEKNLIGFENLSGLNTYQPTVTVSTKRVDSPSEPATLQRGAGLPASKHAGGQKGKNESIQISISDNGNGIPNHIKDKIFQPFFTTKPTGSGTGLGLSLAYDIVTKGHGGELKVETKERKGLSVDVSPQTWTTFKIILPINSHE